MDTATPRASDEELDAAINTLNAMIDNTTEFIALETQKLTAFAEERARIDLLKRMRKSEKVKSIGGVLAAGAAAIYIIDAAFDAAEKIIDDHNAKIEQRLKELKEWKEAHPGINPSVSSGS